MAILWAKKTLKGTLLTASALGGAFVGATVPSVVMAEGFVPLMQNVAPLSAGAVIEDIRIEGAQRLDRATILSSIRIEKGDVATPDAISRSIKTLFATGLFADLHMAVEGGALIIDVVENPVVNSIKFEGTDTINQEDLEKEIQLKPRYVYTLPQVQQDVQRILELYRRSGRFAATCEPHIETLEQNRVDVTFKIDEGQFTGVRRIEFVGNKNFSDSMLRSQINTSESAWWKFFSGSDYYDPDRVNYDKELLRRFYLQHGYVDFRVISAAAEMTPDKRDFFLTFSVDEGERYRFGKIKIESDIKDLDTASLRTELLTLEGAFYDSSEVEKSVTKLTEILGDKQYAFIDILPDVEKHKDELVVDLTYRIKSGKRVYIGRIDIAGNTRTLDKVVRREIPVAEGDPYSISKIKRGEQKIRDLGYFESVKVTPVPGSQPDRSDIKVEVKEKSTGEISVGAGFSSTDGPLGDFSIRERNFMGKGQDVRFGATISGSTKQLDVSFTEPYFLDRDLSAGVDVFHIRRDQQDESSYDAIKTGFSFRLGYPLSSYLRQSLSYTLRQDEISDISDDASRFIRDQ
ncbi:MAG: outer membrane protein assembly factor BamA, partial [Bdellovibrionales bacterium]